MTGRAVGMSRPPRILVVEDEQSLAAVIADVLGDSHDVFAQPMSGTRSIICSATTSILCYSTACCRTDRTGRSPSKLIGRISQSCS